MAENNHMSSFFKGDVIVIVPKIELSSFLVAL